MTKHVAVLMGGWSREREVSLTSGQAVATALTTLGYRVSPIDVKPDIAEVLAKLQPEVAFNALHGRFGEDGCIQGILEVLKIPYTHSGVLASALAMDKPMAKKVFEASGIRTAPGFVTTRGKVKEMLPFAPPVVIKPVNEGSSVGVHIVHEMEHLDKLRDGESPDDEVLVEKYIPGREIQVAVLDDEALGAIEIRPLTGFYDYEAKYTVGKAEHLMPAPLPQKDYEEVMQLALKAHRALGCKGVSRTDFRYDDTSLGQGLFYILETNSQPGMTPLSLTPEIAAHRGMTFGQLVERLITSALRDHGGK